MLMWKITWRNEDTNSDDSEIVCDDELGYFINELTKDESVTDVRVTKES